MKILQICYPGISGATSVALRLVQSTPFLKYDKEILFYGVENVTNDHISKITNINYNSVIFNHKTLIVKKYYKLFLNILSSKPAILIIHSNTISPVIFIVSLILQCKILYVDHNYVKNKIQKLDLFIASFVSKKIICLSSKHYECNKYLIPIFNISKLKIIPNPINTIDKTFKNTDRRNTLILGMASRFESQKKIIELILLIKKYNKKNHTEKIILELAGNGSMINEILAITDENINYVGELQRNQIDEWYRNIDIYIHFSHWETDSISINEAIANCLPVICNKINGVYGNEQYSGLIDFLEIESDDCLSEVISKIKARNISKHMEKINQFIKIRSLDYIAQEYINCLN